jgi:hypothetical protein
MATASHNLHDTKPKILIRPQKTSNKQIPKFKEKSKEIAKEKTTDTPCPPAQLPL